MGIHISDSNSVRQMTSSMDNLTKKQSNKGQRRIKTAKNPVSQAFSDGNGEENCFDIDEDGPYSKYNFDFLKTNVTASSNLMKNTSKKITGFYLAQQYQKLEKMNIKNQNRSQFITNTSLSENLPEIKVMKEKPKFKEMKIIKEQFNQIRFESVKNFYTLKDIIGEGGYGSVYKAKCKLTSEPRAIKVFKQTSLCQEQKNILQNQIKTLRKFDHVNIIKLYDVFFHKSRYYVVTQLCKGGNLRNLIEKEKLSSEYEVSLIMKQIFSALTYMHQQKIAHRDLKLDNIVVLEDKESQAKKIKLIDFGFAKIGQRVVGNKDSRIEGTVSYMPPQGFFGQFSCFSDIWSCGIILCILLIGKNPFKSSSNSKTIENIKNEEINLEGKQWKIITKQAKSLIRSMLQKKPFLRISAKKALNHPFIRKAITTDSNLKDMRSNHKTIIRRFSTFERGNNFSALVKSFICSKRIHQEQRQELAILFETLDTDSSGFIDKKELVELYKVVKGQQAESEVNKLLEKADYDLSGNVDFYQFLVLMTHENILQREDALKAAFQYFDKDKTGFIEKVQLRIELEECDDEEIQMLMQKMDSNQDDKISREQFLQYLSQLI